MQVNLTSVKAPQWANEAQTLVNCLITTSQFGDDELPFTASAEDVEAHGRNLYAELTAGKYGPIAEYQPPAEEPTNQGGV